MKKLRCILVGATGLAGQQFIAALETHPWINLTQIAASPRNAGKTYREAITTPNGMLSWFLSEPLPDRIANMKLADPSQVLLSESDFVFSAVEADVARELEPLYARTLPVISAASAFRYDDDVPLVIPPINAGHIELISAQKSKRGWKGFIVPIPNCTTTGLAMTLAPLAAEFGVQAVMMTSMQAMSGAGRSPGVMGLDIVDNVIPYIPKEEGKVEVETRKILGSPGRQLDLKVSCTCTRVGVLEGHTEAAFVSLAKSASIEAVSSAMASWQGHEWAQGLPSAPPRWISVTNDAFRPQPKRDRDTYGGMATTVGRIREDGVLANGVKYVLVSHNTKMGAAKGAVLLAELLKVRGFLF